jgi:hypothetical protein
LSGVRKRDLATDVGIVEREKMMDVLVVLIQK